MSKAPSHLAEITKKDTELSTEDKFVASVVCTCGNHDFELQHAECDLHESGDPQSAEIDGNFFFVIKARCKSCGENHLIFDADYHGWDGFVCYREYDNRKHPRPPMTSWACPQCSGMHHGIKLEISMDQEIILDDGPIEDEDGNIILDEQNYQNGFDWITMSITCSSCGHQRNSWVEYETM